MIRGKSILVSLFYLFCIHGNAQIQNLNENRTEQLEAMAEKKDGEPEDDDDDLTMEQFGRHPLNMNTAAEEDLVQLHMLNALQIRNFIMYRKLLGPLLSEYELQAVPGLDITTIRKMLPYIIVGLDESVYSALRNRWTGGDGAFLIRGSQIIEKSKGYEKPVKPGASYYEGTAQKVFIRYIYNYRQLLSFGFSAEKDAGEPFFRDPQSDGFDFYSFHFFLRQTGIIRALAIGDFTVNMGQGLIQWQSIAFTKSSMSMAVKREAECLRPYHSAGEFNFHRGVGISLQKNNWQTSIFISSQFISTSRVPDTTGKEDLFSSLQQSGYHRTPSEIADRNNTRQFSAGGNIRYSGKGFRMGINCIHFQFSRAFQKRNEPYNIYSLKGKMLTDYSIDYAYTTGNLHMFGEFAVDQWRNSAFVQGAMISLGENLDMSFLYRNISLAFQSLYSDAFTENTTPNNEHGFYAGMAIRPAPGVQLNVYYDRFVFPWLKYRVDGPSGGGDMLVQVSYQPTKSWQLSTLYKHESKQINAAVLHGATHEMVNPVKIRWGIQNEYTISRNAGFACRMDFVWVKINGYTMKQGFLGSAGFYFRRPGISGNLAGTIFDTDDYDTRVYTYEPDMLYSYSLPAYYGKGIHYYINLHRDLSRIVPGLVKQFHLSAWLRWGQTFYPGVVSVGSGLDQLNGNRRSELKIQLLAEWRGSR